MKKNRIQINKIIQIIMIFAMFLTGQKVFALQGQGDGNGGYVMVSDSGSGSSSDSGGGSGGSEGSGGDGGGGNQNSDSGGGNEHSGQHDNSGAEAQAQREAARAQKEGELNDAKNNSESMMNDISESNDQVATGDDSKNSDGNYNDANSNMDQNDSSGESAQNKKSSKNKLESSDSDSSGDPVRITEGVYEQNEIDLLFGNITSEGVKRKYRSDSKIISSFGYGWSTNLDQRIIRGTDNSALHYIQNLEASVNNIKNAIDEYVQNLKEYYAVSSIDTIEQELNQRIAKCDENLNSTALLYLYVSNLYQQAIGYDAENPILVLMMEVINLQNRINEKKLVLLSRLETVEGKISELNQLKTLYETKQNELQFYKDLNDKRTALELKNAYAKF